jgi:dicarboxylate/amino acid:cation (Na+ or H+) symporter, DAACS family
MAEDHPSPGERSKQRMALHSRILFGLFVGAALGLAANLGLGPQHPLVSLLDTYLAGPVGQVFLRLLFMVVMPLVFSSVALGVLGIGDVGRIGRIGGTTLAFFLLSTLLATCVGLLLVYPIQPGAYLGADVRADLIATYAADADAKIAAAAKTEFGIGTFVGIVTKNPLKSAVDLDMLGVIFFALIFGAALMKVERTRAAALVGFLDGLQEVVTVIVRMAMTLAPYGVAGLVFGVTSRFGLALLVPLGMYVAVVLGGLLLHAVVGLGLIIRVLLGMSPWRFVSLVRAALVTAFSTSSSSATLPTSLEVATERLRIPGRIAGFVLPLGSTMCMNGTALFEGVTVVFLTQVFGIELTLGQTAVLMVMAVITAVGAAGVPGGSIPLLVGVLAMFGVPAEAIAIVLGIDRILDMARTTVNVMGDLVGTAVVARREGSWTPAMIDQDAPAPAP